MQINMLKAKIHRATVTWWKPIQKKITTKKTSSRKKKSRISKWP